MLFGIGKNAATVPEVAVGPERLVGNLLYGPKGEVTAWFILPTRRWAFLTNKARENAVDAFSVRLALLAGHYGVHMRITSIPFKADDWAHGLEEITTTNIGIDSFPEGHPFQTWMEAQKQRVREATTDEKVIYLGVPLTTRRTPLSRVAELLGFGSGVKEGGLQREADLIAEYVSGEGWNGRPCTQAEVEWLLRRSIGLGLPAPKRASVVSEEVPWEAEDMPEISDGVEAYSEAFGPIVKVVRQASSETKQQTRYVAVLTLGRVEGVKTPTAMPWLTLTDRFPWPIEWSIRLDILDGDEARKAIGKKLLVVRDMQRHHAEHELDEPLVLDRQAKRARRVDDEMTSGNLARATRAHGWYRVSVSATTEEKALQRARHIIDTYRHLQMTLVHPQGVSSAGSQLALAQSFTPAAPLGSKAYIRRASVEYLAAGMPTASSDLGDNRGPYIGYTIGSGGRRAVCFDTHYATEVRERSGLVPIVAGLGGGKSTLGGGAFIYPSVMRQIPTFVWDPSGPLAELCKLPEFEGRTRHIDLGSAAPGTLSPFGVVPDPHRADYDTHEDFLDAKTDAAAQRRLLALDTAMGLLPPDLAEDGDTRILMTEAISLTRGLPTASLWTVIEFLKGEQGVGKDRFGERGERIARFLTDMSDMPRAKLFFPSMGRDAPSLVSEDYLLTVITMQGVTLPPRGVDKRQWEPSEQVAMPLLQLATYFTARGIYGMRMHQRKTIFLDECHFLADWAAGRALFNRLARDNRKWNTCVGAASQDPRDILNMNVAALTSTAFVGRIEDEETASEALRLLRVQTGVGYEDQIAALSPVAVDGGRSGQRDFVMRDVDGRVDKVRIDLSHLPHLLEALNTTASGRAVPSVRKSEPIFEEVAA